MDLKEQIGFNIRHRREAIGLSREQVCMDERMLSRRHLIRIELGQVLPTLTKLQFIANQLKVSLSELFHQDNHCAVQDFYDLKEQFNRIHRFGHAKWLDKKYAILEEIYDKCYTILSDDELLLLDIEEKILDLYLIKDSVPVNEIYQERFFQLLKKRRYLIAVI